jgi:VWFA-related protein
MKHLRFWLAALALAGTGIPLAAQQTAGQALRNRPSPPPERMISLNVVVTAKDGKPVGGLQQSDFKILDDKQPQEIRSFRAFDGSQEPVETVLLIDAINTGFDVVAQERVGIDRFLRANGGKLSHPMTLAVFTNGGIQLQENYVRDGNLLADSLAKATIGLRAIKRSAGYDGDAERAQDSIRALQKLVDYEVGRPGRKIILWVSPGWPLLANAAATMSSNQEQAVFDDVTWLSTRLREAQMTIDSINPLGVAEGPGETFEYEGFLGGVKKPLEANYGNLGVQVLATETGGRVLSSGDVSGPLQECVGDADAYYQVTFRPPPAERRDAYHRLEVKLAEPGLTARSTTGYYAEP